MNDQKCLRRIVTSHFLTKIGDQMWAFSIPLVFVAIFTTSIMPAALYGLLTTFVRVILGTTVGVQMDKQDRLFVVWLGTLVQGASVGICGVLIFILAVLSGSESEVSHPFAHWHTTACFAGTIACGVVQALGAQAMDIAVERDWVPAALPETLWPSTNAWMRRIDLTTEIAAPFVASALMMPWALSLAPAASVPSTVVGTVLVALINLVSFIPQYLLLRQVYFARPALALHSHLPQTGPHTTDTEPDRLERVTSSQPLLSSMSPGRLEADDADWAASGDADWADSGRAERGVVPVEQEPVTRRGDVDAGANPLVNMAKAVRVFAQQPVMLVQIAYTCLWITSLSPHGLVMTAYLKAISVPDFTISLFRGGGALVGVLATFLFPPIASYLGLHTASLIFIVQEGLALIIALLAFLSYTTSHTVFAQYTFLSMIVFSRVGLYGFDIGEVQIVQRSVPEAVRGTVSSVESSLTSLATLLVDLLGVVVARPDQFVWHVIVTTGAINTGAVLFALWLTCWVYHEHPHVHGKDHVEPFHFHIIPTSETADIEGADTAHSHGHYHRRKAAHPLQQASVFEYSAAGAGA